MPDQVPFSIFEFAERSGLAFKLLYAVLAKYTEAGSVRFLDAFWFHGLAYSHERDGMRIAANTRRGAGDMLPNSRNILSNGHAKIIGGRRTKTSPRMNTDRTDLK
jgi:hypothetical protein